MLIDQKLIRPKNGTEIRMLKCMCEHTWRDMILNEDIQHKIGMTSVVDNIREED